MRDFAGKRYWIVGASDGLGAALAHKLSARGAVLVLSARSEDKLAALAADLPGPSEVRVMDVTDDGSVAEAAGIVGPVDGLVYLAGVYWPMNILSLSVVNVLIIL